MVDRLEALAKQARAGPWEGLREAWRAFAAELDAQFVARERGLLFTHRGLAQREQAQRIAQEHAAARALVEEIDRQIVRRQPRAASFDLLTELLRGAANGPNLEPGDPLS